MNPPVPRQSACLLYVIYDHPSDFPDEYVCRRWELDGLVDEGHEPYLRAATLEEIRRQLPYPLVCIGRWAQDDPAILEVWV